MYWMRGCVAGSLFLCVLFIGEVAYRSTTIADVLGDEPIDLQTPHQLILKLDRLRKFEGYKVVLIGDSIVYGGVLKDFGDAQWREHTLTALLQAKYAKRFPGKNVLIMNLGINGALPEDTECVTKLVRACKPDVVIYSTHLRPFSDDFDADAEAMARPWLRDIAIGDDEFHYRPANATWASESNRALADFARQHFSFIRHRDTIQAMMPQATVSRIETDRLDVLGQIQGRFRSVHIDENHRQLRAQRRTLGMLRADRQRAVFFYVKEHPVDVHSVIDVDEHRAHYAKLMHFYDEFLDRDVSYVAPIAELAPEHYLDFSHLNHAGYVILAEHLWKSLTAKESGHD